MRLAGGFAVHRVSCALYRRGTRGPDDSPSTVTGFHPIPDLENLFAWCPGLWDLSRGFAGSAASETWAGPALC